MVFAEKITFLLNGGVMLVSNRFPGTDVWQIGLCSLEGPLCAHVYGI